MSRGSGRRFLIVVSATCYNTRPVEPRPETLPVRGVPLDIVPMTLSGRTAVVTGATEGIGFAIARALAAAGARVAVCSRDARKVERTVASLREEGGIVTGAPCDVRDPDAVDRLHAHVVSEWGPADVLVNNAGLAYLAPLTELSLEQIDHTFAVNVRGVFVVTRAFVPDMIERGTGSIVNVVSLAGRNGFVGGTAYAASKHAVLGFSRSLMLELRPHGIRVVAVCPGSVATAFFDKAGVERNNLDRVLQPEDIAATVIHALTLPDRALVSEIDVRPTNP